MSEHDTSWFTRLFWFTLGAGAGAAAAALLDQKTAAQRRDQLWDQAESFSQVADEARKKADYAAGVAKGETIEAAKQAVPEGAEAPEDPKTLRQRIRSEVLGHVEGTDDVVVTVHSEGQVTLKGRVGSEEAERTLLDRTREVPGVNNVESELTVA